jgi:rhodanese-related sulfurtransferase
MLSEIAAAWAVRLGYTNVSRYPAGYRTWKEEARTTAPDAIPSGTQ